MLTSKSIILKNQFANKNNISHGKTPSRFVTDYMARNNATLTTYPVTDATNLQTQYFNDSQNIYSLQKEQLLTRKAHYSRKKVTSKSWFNLTTLEGRGFNQNSLSLSKNGIELTAANLQSAFNQGHTILEMVASFDNDYLHNLGVEKFNKPRDFHKDIDEMKLRIAVQIGCHTLAQNLGYVQPVFAGAIQLDRDHPHAHIAMCETSKHTNAKKFYDGTEYGRLTKTNKKSFMEAIDNSLTNMKSLAFMPSDQVEQAQLANENYAQNYQLLMPKKQIMLYQAAPDNSPLKVQLLNELSLRPFSQKQIDQKKQILQNQRLSTDKQQPLPAIYALNLETEHNLARINNPLASLILKRRKIKKQREKLRLKQKRLLKQYLYFKRSLVNSANQATIIDHQILPYYKQAISNNAIELEYYALFDYHPPKKLSSFKKQAQALNTLKTAANTPLAKTIFKEQALTNVINWQTKYVTDSQSVIVTLNSRDDDLKMPYLKPNALTKIKPTDSKFKNIKLAKNYEAELALNAFEAIKILPQTAMTKRASADLNLELMNVSNKLDEQTPVKNKPLRQIKSVSYQKAEDLLIDLT